jgi:hypothetical protein
MKKIRFILFILVALLPGAQSCKPPVQTLNDRLASGAKAKLFLDERRFLFTPQSMKPQTVPSRLVNGFSMRLNGETLWSYLPYFGVSYAPSMASMNGPLDFTTKEFSWSSHADKDGGATAELKFTGNVDVTDMSLNTYGNGYGTLSVRFKNRQSISFYGLLEPLKEPEVKK